MYLKILVGTFRFVRNTIQEDEASPGVRFKQSGYKLRMISMNN